MVSKVKHRGGGGIMVWGCMAASGTGNIFVINSIMDHLYYIQILKENLSANAEKLDIEEDYKTMTQNTPLTIQGFGCSTTVQKHGQRAMNMNRYTNAELADIRFIYDLGVAVRLYGERYPTRWQPNHQTFARVH
ncbi:hypothetical protein TNCV_1539811 [Trichonephila clavipes]|nr:hypothetical protein TNCV_1539811 [Trichonephila clavipes]